jgi:MYXO-CTERM domain-containing protein
MYRRSWFVLLAAALLAAEARADLVPPGEKSVRLSILVEAQVPEGKALILAHTFRAIDVIKPGAAAPVEWHPLGGKMQILAVPAASLDDKVEQRRKDLDRASLEKIAAAGKPCHEPFNGFRTVSSLAPADEIRWVYKVTFAGDACTAILTRMELYDRDGKPAPANGLRDLPPVPVGTGAAPGTPPPGPSAAPTPPPGPSAVPAPPPTQKGACGCEIGPGAAPPRAALGAMAIGLLFWARRRRRA